jgi:hypothetical protein
MMDENDFARALELKMNEYLQDERMRRDILCLPDEPGLEPAIRVAFLEGAVQASELILKACQE